jgi:ribosomal protein S18 acetylase RimI-like enzyme
MDDVKEWHQTLNGQSFTVSTAPTLSHAFIQQAMSTEAMYWTKPISSTKNLQKLLDNCCTLGLYINDVTTTTNNNTNIDDSNDVSKQQQHRTPIGMARMVTDYVTLAYLTDVYVQDTYQGLGLGKWLVRCCRAIALDMSDLRFMVLLTGSQQAEAFYRRELGMQVMGRELELSAMGARKPALEEAAAVHRTHSE